MRLTTTKSTTKYYYCVQYLVNDLFEEYGNEQTRAKILNWVIANLESLPKGEGKIILKKVVN